MYAAISCIAALLIAIFFLPESPKWLYEKERFNECAKSLLHIGKINGVSDMHTVNALMRSQSVNDVANSMANKIQKESVGTEADAQIVDKENKSVFKEIMKDGMMFRNFLGMMMVWSSSAFGYYLISFQLKYVHGDFFTNNMTSAVSEAIAYITSGLIFKFMGLKATFISSYVIAIAGMLSLTITQPTNQILLCVFILGSKYGVCQIFNLAYVGTTYLFPVAYVATVFGICNFFARGCQTVSPYIAELQPPQIAQWVFIIMMGTALLVSFIIKDPKLAKQVSSSD